MANKRAKKRSEVDGSRHKKIRREITSDLEVYDLFEWQRACTSFAPIKYQEYTRKQWFRENQSKLTAGREMVEFVENWVKNLSERRAFEDYTMTALRNFLIGIVRQRQESLGIETGRLNVVKLAGFKTLVKWAENRDELDKGPFAGADEKSSEMFYEATRGRKHKAKYSAPLVDLCKDYELHGENRILLVIGLTNPSTYPFQNVEIELIYGAELSIASVEPYGWAPRDNRIRINFLAATLDSNPYEVEIRVILTIQSEVGEYHLRGKILYDDSVRGEHVENELESVSLVIS